MPQFHHADSGIVSLMAKRRAHAVNRSHRRSPASLGHDLLVDFKTRS